MAGGGHGPPFWTTKPPEPNRVIVGREPVIGAVLRLAWAVPEAEAGPIADAVIPLAFDRRQDHDYPNVVNLLANLARRGGPDLKARLGDQLFPKGQPIDTRLAQAAAAFGKVDALTPDSIERFAGRVEQDIRLQVQRVRLGEDAQRPAEMLYEFTQPLPDGVLKVFAAPTVGLHSLAAHRERLSQQAVAGIVRAILDTARDRDNFCNPYWNRSVAVPVAATTHRWSATRPNRSSPTYRSPVSPSDSPVCLTVVCQLNEIRCHSHGRKGYILS